MDNPFANREGIIFISTLLEKLYFFIIFAL
nr:MAG TPA: hypothetical protein [Caudoviricetes sp.]